MSARIISTVGRAIDVIVAGRVVSHLRFAAGVCVLAAGLLMGSAGGAVAVADPDSSGSAAHGDGGTNASGQGSTTASSPVGNVTDTRRKTIQGVTSTLGSGRQRGQQPSTGAKSPKKEPGGTDTRGREKRLGPRRRGSRSWPVRAGSQCGGAGSQCGGAGSQCWSAPVPNRRVGRRFPMWSRRFPMWWRRFPMWWRRFPMWWRRFPMWWRRFLRSCRSARGS